MKLREALQVREAEQLKQLGSFREVKAGLEEQLGAKLRVNGWHALFQRLLCLREHGRLVSEQVLRLVNEKKCSEAKQRLEEQLGLHPKSATPEELTAVGRALKQCTWPINTLDADARFEATKRKNFLHSSRLEGIELEASGRDITVDEVVALLKREANG